VNLARAPEKKQKRYNEDRFTWTDRMNITTFFFEAFDEDWKSDWSNPPGAEKHRGLFTVNRQPKLGMQP
jgi:exo-beta-1,3-glucanase (GH17 family)